MIAIPEPGVETFEERIQRTINEGFTNVNVKIDNLRAEVGDLRAEVGGLRAEVGGLRAEVGDLCAEVGDLRAEVSVVRNKVDRLGALQQNSMKARNQNLEVVPNNDGVIPDDDLFPRDLTLNHLLVAGNERLPVTGEQNTWNKSKSLRLLQFYGIEDGYNSETDNEQTVTARVSRLQVAAALGVPKSQIQQGILALTDV